MQAGLQVPCPPVNGPPASARPSSASAAVPQNADDTRGYHFRRGVRSPPFWVLTGAVALIVLVVVAVSINLALGAGGAALVVLLGLGVVWWLATRAAERDFFRAYANARGLDRRYEVFAGEHDDMNSVRQLFEPTFIVWLTETAPEEFAFELEAGVLCCNVKDHLKSAAELDALCKAAGSVAQRFGAEITE